MAHRPGEPFACVELYVAPRWMANRAGDGFGPHQVSTHKAQLNWKCAIGTRSRRSNHGGATDLKSPDAAGREGPLRHDAGTLTDGAIGCEGGDICENPGLIYPFIEQEREKRTAAARFCVLIGEEERAAVIFTAKHGMLAHFKPWWGERPVTVNATSYLGQREHPVSALIADRPSPSCWLSDIQGAAKDA